ncbi:MAG: hypothetical protein WBB28_20440 [Crinalium sp.]
MAIIALKAWYLEQYEPIKELELRPQDLRLSKNSLLKSGLRADFLEDSKDVKDSNWFQRYLEGETVEFYIEGSGGYIISNIDLISHEIYFTKQEVMAQLDPVIFVSYQSEYQASNQVLVEVLNDAIENINQRIRAVGRSRIPITIEASPRPTDAPIRLNNTMLRKIRKSLLFIGDSTPITQIGTQDKLQLIPSPNVCVEIGYALQCKRSEQILLVQMQRPDFEGELPFDLPNHQQLLFKTADELHQTLPQMIDTLLQRFNLFSSI